MITVNKQPDDAVLARNDVKYELETDNLVLTSGVEAECYLLIQALSGNTGTFTVNFLGLAVVFTSVSGTPSPTAYEFKDGTFANYTDYGNHMILMLKKHYVLVDNYDITIDVVSAFGVTLKLKAKQKGPAYNISIASTVTNIVQTTTTTGVSTINRDRFKILHDVFFEKTYASNNFELVFNGSAVPDAGYKAIFNLTDVLRSLLNLHVPTFANVWVFLNNSIKRFYTRYAESYGFPTEISTAGFTDTKLAFLGAQNFVTAAQETFFSYINESPRKSITAMPQNTTMAKAQKQYLSFYVVAPIRPKLLADLYYTDGTHEVVEAKLYDEITVTGVYTFMCGYTQLGIDALKASGKTVSKYVLTWWDAAVDEIYTQDFTFKVDLMPQLFARYILFFNSFGMPETMYFTGKQLKNAQFKSDLVRNADLQFDNDAAIYDGEFTEINNELQFAYELNSGWKTSEWVSYFNDFLLSRKRYLQASNKWVGLNIPAQKIQLQEDDSTLFAVKFNYQDSFIEKGIAE